MQVPAEATAFADRAEILERARALARALGESPEMRAFETSQEAIHADRDLLDELAQFQLRQRDLQLARSWGGSDPEAEQALSRSWDLLAARPAVAAQIEAREALVALLRDVVADLSEGTGIDYGAACAPAGGCCG